MGSETLELRLTSTHFRVFAGQASATTVQSAADALERQYARVLSDLNVTSLGPITVRIWQDEAAYYAALVSSTFANNPRWLWETVALYENGELVPPRTLGYMVRGAYPSLADLNADPNASRQIYELGYVIGEFIVTRWGRAGLLDLIRANGDVNAVFGVTPAAFEAEMYASIRAKYL